MEANVLAADAIATKRQREERAGHEIPLFEPRPGGPAERFAGVLGDRHPVLAFFLALVSGYLLLAVVSIALGLLVTDVLLDIDSVQRLDERFPSWLAGNRTSGWTDASWVGTELAGGYVIPIALGLIGLVMAILRKWRVAAYVLFAVAVESATYRVTTLFVERRRPDVVRLSRSPSTRATRPGTRQRRSPCTAGSPSSSRRGSRAAPGAYRFG